MGAFDDSSSLLFLGVRGFGILAGVLLLVQAYMDGITKNFGMLLTGIWVGIPSLLALLSISLGSLGILGTAFNLLGLVAGLLLWREYG